MMTEHLAHLRVSDAMMAIKIRSDEKSKTIAGLRAVIRRLEKENNKLRIAHKAATYRENETEKRRVALLQRINEIEKGE